jgi:hypothetical protein
MRDDALALFARVFAQATGRYGFVFRGLRLENDWLSFYVRPVDGLLLPDIMKWLKQVFAQRFNGMDGRIGHVWGDRYWSEILEGEPPEEEGAAAGEEVGNPRVRPQYREGAKNPHFLFFFLHNPPISPLPAALRPG